MAGNDLALDTPRCRQHSLIPRPESLGKLWYFKAWIFAAFGLGFCSGYFAAPWVSDNFLFGPLQYLKAIKVIAWDFRHVSQVLQSWSGAPVLSGTSSAGYFIIVGFGYCCCSLLGLSFQVPEGVSLAVARGRT